MTYDEKKIANLMQNLKISRQERIDVIEYDYKVDHNEKTEYDLTPEQQKVSKEARRAKGNTVYKFTKRERKADNEKADIIAKIAEIFGENAQITNAEREISLTFGENEYSVTLVKHRATKK